MTTFDATADVTVRGLGFTGLATAVTAARAGFRVVGLDDSVTRVREIAEVHPGCGLTTVSEHELRAQLASEMLRVRDVSTDPPCAEIHVICVPTPAGNSDGADLTPLTNAVDSVADTLRPGDLVLVQSTCPPGTIERLVVPRIVERSGLRPGTDCHVAHSPVRIDPGVRDATLWSVPRVVAGVTAACTAKAVEFLRRVTEHVVPVSTARVAELVKVFENTFRLVNISLVNELAELCLASDVDPAEVLAAAATKPYGFLRHQPGVGAGGDCVPVCASFFSAVARRAGVSSAVVDAAITLNDAMPAVVISRVERLLAAHRLPSLPGSRVLVVGVTYKPDVANVRRSAAVEVLARLRALADVAYHDAYVPRLTLDDGTVLRSTPLDQHCADIVLVLTKHASVEHDRLSAPGTVVVDCATGEPALIAGTECGHAN
jgi:UDP-N-acetyl-D-glucosamine dehydrogenase